MRSHGWAGNTPASDEEAIERILNAADRIISERGSAMRIADVARDLCVTRQTVYRYFPGTEALLVATAMRSADGFLDHLAAHLKGTTDPVVAMTEGVAFAIEELASDNQVEFVLSQRQRGGQRISIMSDTALAFGRSMLHNFDVDWEQHGFDEAGLDELAEFCLRVLAISPAGLDPRSHIRSWRVRWTRLAAPSRREPVGARRQRPDRRAATAFQLWRAAS
jgi:AcrR family transcriptional regulator